MRHKENRITSRIALAIIASMVTIGMAAQTPAERPTRVVGTLVDGLNSDYLKLLKGYFGEGGFKRLMRDGVTLENVEYGPGVDRASATAMIFTGATASVNGISASTIYDTEKKIDYPILLDPSKIGNYTNETYSPSALLVSTLADEIRIDGGGTGYVYSIAPDATQAILMAGHAANACCWLDADTHKWVTTSFYPEGLPAAADEMNMNGRIGILAEREWTPRMDIAMYNRPTEKERKRGFSYLNKEHLLHSPAANTLVIEMALALQKAQQLGTDLIPDLLLLQLNTLSPQAQSDAIESAEQEDMYMGINQDLGFLMEQLGKRIGKENYQILVVGRPIKGHSSTTLEMANLPIQTFNVDRAAALTGTYLMAIYGHERWVDGGHGPFIYLNRMLIEKKRMSLETIQRQVANFLMDFEGVQVAYPIHEAITSDHKHSIYRKHAGDVYFQLQDNWLLEANENTPFDQVIQSEPVAPVLYWSGTITSFPEGKLQATDIKSLIINGSTH